MQKAEFENLCETVERVITWSETKEDLYEADDEKTSLSEEHLRGITSGALHRLERNTAVIVGGRTNSGKTSAIRQIYSDVAIKFRFNNEVLETQNMPDVTLSLTRVPFGRADTENTERLTLYDTPGLSSDKIPLENVARTALGLKQIGAEDQHIPAIPLIELGLPGLDGVADIQTIGEDDDRFVKMSLHELGVLTEDEIKVWDVSEAERKKLLAIAKHERACLKVDHVDAYLNRDALICIYVINAVETPFSTMEMQAHIDALREIYHNRLLVVATHMDIADGWEERQKQLRYELLNALTGGTHIFLSGVTGEGVEQFAHKFLGISGYEMSTWLKHLKIESQSIRLFFAANALSRLLIAAFFSKSLNKEPEKYLYPGLTLMTELAIEYIYGHDEEVKQDADKKAKDDAKALVDRFVDIHQRFYEERRAPKGIREWFISTFTGKILTRTIEVTEQEINDPVTLLAMLYYLLYSHIYETERREESPVLITPAVTKEAALDWFKNEFAPYEALIQTRENAFHFYENLGDVLARFWETFHPEVLPIRRERPEPGKDPKDA